MIHRLVSVVILITLSVACTTGYAQNQRSSPELLAKFTQQEINDMDEATLAYWDFFAHSGFEVFEISKDKSESEMEMIDFSGSLEKINPLALGLLPEPTAVKTYRLGDTGHGIMILSEKKILAKMERTAK